VRAALEKESPSLLDRIQVPAMGLEYVAATGAACRARQITIFPEILRPQDEPYHLMHDEHALRLTSDDGDTRYLTLEDLSPVMPANCRATNDTDPLQGYCAYMRSATMDEWLLQREETFLSVGGCVLS